MSPARPRVVVTVFDGLRPDLIKPEITPNILRVAARGTWFRNSRGVFPSVTRVSTSSIATGAPPTAHGIVGNAFYFPEVLPDRVLDTSKREDIQAAEAFTKGRFIDADTFGDQLAKTGKRMAVVHTGSAGSTHAINPRAAQNGHWTFSIHGEETTTTPQAVRECVAKFGALPGKELPKLKDQDYAARVMVEHVLPSAPDVALTWFSEPDTSFHYLEIGSEGSMKALRNADKALGEILDWVEAQPDADEIAVIVASDHGQISTSAALPLHDQAGEAGFKIGRGSALNGARFVATSGSSGEIRLQDGDRAELDRLAAWLIEHPDVSHVFSRGHNEVEGEIAGTLSLAAVGQGHARSADLMFILRSDLSKDIYGLPGLGLLMPGDVAPGGGYHGGLNPHELNTTLIISAPGRVEAGKIDPSPAGIIDIGPTILDIVGAPKADTMIGRSLIEPANEAPRERVLETGKGDFNQRVVTVEQGGRTILMNGGQQPVD